MKKYLKLLIIKFQLMSKTPNRLVLPELENKSFRDSKQI